MSHCSVIKVSVSQTACLLYHIFQCLSRTFLIFSNFCSFWNFESLFFIVILYDFQLFPSFRQLIKIITIFSNCQHLFLFFLKLFSVSKNGEGGIWTLAPVTRPIPLAGAPLRPLEYFSRLRIHNLLCNLKAFLSETHCLLYIRIFTLSTSFFNYLK